LFSFHQSARLHISLTAEESQWQPLFVVAIKLGLKSLLTFYIVCIITQSPLWWKTQKPRRLHSMVSCTRYQF
jgi:hypothetical protein